MLHVYGHYEHASGLEAKVPYTAKRRHTDTQPP